MIFWLAPIAVGAAIGRSKHRAGWAWGLFLGWLGVIILVLLTPGKPLTLERLEAKKGVTDAKYYEKKKAELFAAQTHRECPHCKEEMRRDASVCPHCQRESQAWTQNEGYWWRPAEDGSGWLYLDELSGEWRVPATSTA